MDVGRFVEEQEAGAAQTLGKQDESHIFFSRSIHLALHGDQAWSDHMYKRPVTQEEPSLKHPSTSVRLASSMVLACQ